MNLDFRDSVFVSNLCSDIHFLEEILLYHFLFRPVFLLNLASASFRPSSNISNVDSLD